MISQIDNMVCELVLPEEPEQQPVAIPRFGLNPDNGMMYESKRGPWCLFKDIPQQRKPMTDEQKDAERYRWLFNDVDMTAIKTAFDEQKTPPTNMHSQVIEQIVGYYMDKQSADAMIDCAMKSAHGIKE